MCNACDNINSQPTKFVNLHVHSCYSLLDGLSKVEDIVSKVKKMGQSSFAITEHGNVFSAVKARKLAKEHSLKHLYGIEFYVTSDRFTKDKASKYNHLTVLAKNEQGRLNINKLSSLGYIEGFYSKPRVDHQLLKDNREGLVVLSGCFLAGTTVLTNEGLKNIEDVEAGQQVLTHKGNWKDVAFPTVNDYKGEIHSIKTLGGAFKVDATHNHKFFVVKNPDLDKVSDSKIDNELFNTLINNTHLDLSGKNRKYKARYKRYSKYKKPEWIAAEELNAGDIILTPVNTSVKSVEYLPSTNIKVDNDLLELLGIYAAEGSVDSTQMNRINFSIRSSDVYTQNKIKDVMLDKFGVKPSISFDKEKTCTEICYSGKHLAKLFSKELGIGAKNKKVPNFVKELHPSQQAHFIKGAMLGDGSFRFNDSGMVQDIRYVTISKQLASDLSYMFNRLWVNPSLSEVEGYFKDGVNHQKSYYLAISSGVANAFYKFIWGEDTDLNILMHERREKDIPYFHNGAMYARQKITDITKEEYEGIVHCLNVEDDHSFIANGLSVHNCMASEFQQALAGGKIGNDDVIITEQNIENAKNVARFYRNIFGQDYYLEVQSHSDPRQQKLNRAVVDIAKELGIPFVVTADSHFVDEEDYELHGIFIQIGQNREAGETYLDGQLQSEEEARRLLKPALTDDEIDEAIRYTSIIADKCNVEIPITAPQIPHIKVPEPFKSEAEYLKHLCVQGWNRLQIQKMPNVKEYQQRLLYEYDAIVKMGFEGYYLLVESYSNSVKRRGVARGSGGGSLVAYLLNITRIDPVKYGLYFERFIDVGALDLLERGEMTRSELKIPDIDLDFGKVDREIIINYIINRYGEDKFASLGQFGMMKDKTAVKDVGKVLGIDFNETNKITKLIDEDTISEAIEDGRLKDYVKKYPKLFDYAQKIAGVPKSFGVHPSGKAITIHDLFDYTSVLDKDGVLTFQGDMHDTDDLGIVKIDVLGLRTIDVIYDTLEMIGKTDDYIAPEKLNYSDKKVLELFRNGHTVGVFQFESTGMQNTLKKMKPSGLDDLAVANALFRPGSMKFIDVYTKRKHGEEEVVYLHEDLKPILETTYAVIVFQEQLIEIGRLAKLKNPDLLRQATGKKDIKKMNKVKPELVNGLKELGWNDETIEELWSVMLDFAKYSFNKSHSYAYAMIAFMTAFLKVYHPKEFICSLLNSWIGENKQDKYEQIEKTYREAKRLGVTIELPSKLEDFSDKCYIKDGKVIYGLQLVKTINAQSPLEMSKLGNREYQTFVDLIVDIMTNTTVQTGHMKTFIQLGLFDKYGSRNVLLEIYSCMADLKKADFELYPEFADYTEIVKGEEKVRKIPLKYDPNHAEKTKLQRLENLSKYEKLVRSRPPKEISVGEQVLFEKEMLGFPITTLDVPPSHCVVTEINSKYTPIVKFYQPKTNEEHVAKIKKQTFYNQNLENGELVSVGDYIEILNTFKDYKWRKTENGFEQDMNQQELFISNLRHIK